MGGIPSFQLSANHTRNAAREQIPVSAEKSAHSLLKDRGRFF